MIQGDKIYEYYLKNKNPGESVRLVFQGKDVHVNWATNDGWFWLVEHGDIVRSSMLEIPDD